MMQYNNEVRIVTMVKKDDRSELISIKRKKPSISIVYKSDLCLIIPCQALQRINRSRKMITMTINVWREK